MPDAGKLSYAFEDWLFHVVSRSGTVYLAVASADAGRRMPFAFLSELEKKVPFPSGPASATGDCN